MPGRVLTAPDAQAIDAVVLDLVMPGLDGMGVLEKIRDAGLNLPVIVQTAHGGIDNVVSAMRAGAQDFVVKPVGFERLQVSLRNALNASALKGELQRIRHSREGRLTFADIITRSETMAGVLRTAQKAAASTIPVLIEGKSGVGKELFARAIHGSGERKAKPFVAVNCGAIPDNLVESILFGHEKGAFTGATERHLGKFVEASGGTLFSTKSANCRWRRRSSCCARCRKVPSKRSADASPSRSTSASFQPPTASCSTRSRTAISRGPVLSPACAAADNSAVADAARGHPASAAAFPGRFCAEENRPITGISGEAMAHLLNSNGRATSPAREAVYRAVVISEGDQLGLADFPQSPAQPSAPVDTACLPSR